MTKTVILFRLGSRYVHDVVTADKTVAVTVLEVGAYILLRLFHSDVHMAIQTRKNAAIIHSTVQSYLDRLALQSFIK